MGQDSRPCEVVEERKRNILLDGLAHQVEPEGAESEGTPLPPLQKD